jgi:hypothetical protein
MTGPEPQDGPEMIRALLDHMVEKATNEVGAPDGLRQELCLLMAVFVSARDFMESGSREARKAAVGATKRKHWTPKQAAIVKGIECQLDNLQHAVAREVIDRLEALVSRNRFNWMSRN